VSSGLRLPDGVAQLRFISDHLCDRCGGPLGPGAGGADPWRALPAPGCWTWSGRLWLTPC